MTRTRPTHYNEREERYQIPSSTKYQNYTFSTVRTFFPKKIIFPTHYTNSSPSVCHYGFRVMGIDRVDGLSCEIAFMGAVNRSTP